MRLGAPVGADTLEIHSAKGAVRLLSRVLAFATRSINNQAGSGSMVLIGSAVLVGTCAGFTCRSRLWSICRSMRA